MTSTPLRSPETPPHKQGGWVGKKNNGTHVGLSAAVRPRSRLDVRVRVGVGDGAVTQVRSMPCSAVVGLQQAELRMTQPMASLLANMRLARRLAPRNPRRCAASCVSARLRPQATPPLGGTTQWGGSKLPPHRAVRPFGGAAYGGLLQIKSPAAPRGAWAQSAGVRRLALRAAPCHQRWCSWQLP